jgi:hypothetical protein
MLAGSMNMMGNLAGFVAPWLGGYILQRTADDWNILLYVMAGMYFLGTRCWPFIDPSTQLEAMEGPGGAGLSAGPQATLVPVPAMDSINVD